MFESTFIEQNVVRQMSGGDKLLRGLSMGFTILNGVLYAFTASFIFLVPFVLFIILTYFVYQNSKQDFDYILTGSILDLDKIKNKSKRKAVASIDLGKDLIVLAPSRTEPVKEYIGKKMPTLDLTSHEEGRNYYTMIAQNSTTGRLTKILFEPNQEMLTMIYRMQPRKVHETANRVDEI